MKQSLIILLLVVSNGFISKIYAQQSSRQRVRTDTPRYWNANAITINFNSISKTFDLVKPPKYVGEGGEGITIIIKHFNPFLYNLNITERQGIYQNSEKLSEKTTGAMTYKQIGYELKDLTINAATIQLPSIALSAPLQTVNRQIKVLEDTLLLQRNRMKQLFSAMSLVTTAADTLSIKQAINVWESAMETSHIQKKRLEKEADEISNDGANDANKIKRYNDKVSQLIAGLRNINQITNYYRTLMNTLTVDGLNYEFLEERKMTNLKKYFPEWNATEGVNTSVFFNTILQSTQAQFSDMSNYFLGMVQTLTDPGLRTQLTENYKEIQSVYGKINFESFSNLIDHIDKIYLSVNSNLFSIPYYTKIIDDDADAIYFDITATPVSGEDLNVPLQPVKLSFSVPIVGGAKIDISTGFGFNVGLFDRKYRYERLANGKYVVAENKNNSLFNPNIVVMAHLYRRNAIRNHRPNVCVGVGTSDAERFRYYVGAGWIIGRKQRMNFLVGAVGGQVDYADQTVLDKELTLTEEQLIKPIPKSDPAPFRIGGFLALTFNLTGSNSVFAKKISK